MGEQEQGICNICHKEKILQREYYHYDIKCECHSPKHFECVKYCNNCIPTEPEETKITIKTSQLN